MPVTTLHRVQLDTGHTDLLPLTLPPVRIYTPAFIPNRWVGKPDLPEGTLLRWVILFPQMEKGRQATQRDKDVWDQDRQGRCFKVEGENWNALNATLFRGGRGLEHLKGHTLPTFRELHGITDDYDPADIHRWIVLFHEKETGRYPTHADKIVWDKDENGEWFQVEGESWNAIDSAFRHGRRGLFRLKERTLSQFRHAHGLVNPPRPRALQTAGVPAKTTP